MLKHILTVIFMFMGISCYSNQGFSFTNDSELNRKHIALIYTGIGNGNVLLGEYNLAIDEFNKAAYLISKLEKRDPVVEFWISFGKAVAYDNLWNREECERAIGRLILTIFEFEGEGDEEEFYTNIIDDKTLVECEEMINMMHKIASTSPSLDVRSVLETIVESVAEEIAAIFEISDFSEEI